MQPFRAAFVAICAAVAAANNSLELVRDVALEDVPAGPRELHQRYSEIFRYGNRNAASAPCAEIQAEVRARSYASRRIVLVAPDRTQSPSTPSSRFVDFRTGRISGRATSSTARRRRRPRRSSCYSAAFVPSRARPSTRRTTSAIVCASNTP